MNNSFVVGVAISSESLLFAIMILSGFLGLAILISMMKIYKKAGMPSISAIIPIWSQINLFKIVEKPAWYVLLLFIPIVGIIINIQAYILLAKKFGKGFGFGIAMIFLPMIFIPLLSFSDYIKTEKEADEPVYNPFNQTDVEQVMPSAPMEPVAPTAPVMESNEVEQTPINEIISQETEEYQPTTENAEENNFAEPETINAMEMEQPIVEMSKEENVMEAPISDIPVISEIPAEEVIVPEVAPQPILSESVPVGAPMSNINLSSIETENTNQDIQTVSNQKPNELNDIAFNSTPVVEQPSSPIMGIENLASALNSTKEEFNSEILEMPTNNITEEKSIEQENNMGDLEMPEIAAKTCPACGISLSADTKNCPSCGIPV